MNYSVVTKATAANSLAVLGMTSLIFLVNYQIYELTNNLAYLGLYGGVFFAGKLVSLLPAGLISDTFNRGSVARITALATFGITLLIALNINSILWLFINMFLLASLRPYWSTALRSLIGEHSTIENMQSNASHLVGTHELGSVLGPLTAGLLLDLLKDIRYPILLMALFQLAACLMLLGVHSDMRGEPRENKILDGVKFVLKEKVLLTAFSLDMLAVMFGGCIALLPAFAKDILMVGPTKLGILQAAIPTGAIFGSFVLMRTLRIHKAGYAIGLGAIGFGMCNLLFGLSSMFWLSAFLLFASGVFDNLSTIVRETVTNTITPNHLRGRVFAVKSLFINASNDLGRLESGFAAYFLGLQLAVVSGAVVTVLTTVLLCKKSKAFMEFRIK